LLRQRRQIDYPGGQELRRVRFAVLAVAVERVTPTGAALLAVRGALGY